MLYALIDSARCSRAELPAGLSRPVWILLILLLPGVGALVWIVLRVVARTAEGGNGGRPAAPPRPSAGPRPGPRPGPRAPRRPDRPTAPDDDPAFLAALEQQRRREERQRREAERRRQADSENPQHDGD